MSKIRIIHLEDVFEDAELVGRALKSADIDFERVIVDTREEFTLALETFQPDIILSDHSMPAFNSIEAMDILKESGKTIPFILVTGAVSEEFAVVALNKGADDYILKDRLQRLPIAVNTILEKYKLEIERKRTEILLRSIDTNSIDVICISDNEGRFVHVSAACKNMWGYDPAELIGKEYIDLVYEEDIESTKQAAVSIMSGNPFTTFENRIVHKNGSIVPILWSPYWDDNQKYLYAIAKDVSEKKRMEQALKTEQQRFIDLFLEAPAAIGILKGPNHVYETYNPYYEQLVGCKNMLGKPVAEVFPELKSMGTFELLDRVYQHGETISKTEVLLQLSHEGSKHARELHVNFVYQPYRNAEGKIEGVFFFIVDVSEQAKARRKIEAEKALSDSIINSLPGVFFLFNANGKLLRWNKNLETVSGYSADEIRNMHPLTFFDEKEKHLLKRKIESAFINGVDEVDTTFVTKSGERKSYYYTARATTFEGTPCLIGVGLDISERQKIEEENRKLGLIASLTVNAVVITDAEGKITWVNDGFEKITEYVQAEVIGKKPGEFLQGPKTNAETVEHMRESIKNGEGFRVEILNYTKTGKEYWLDIEVKPLHDSVNNLTGFMAIQQDITDRKKTEEETLALVNNLQKRNNDLHQFSYIVSHNLRAPIARMLGLAHIFDSKEEDNAFIVDQLAREVASLDDVVKDINVIVSARDIEKQQKEPTSLESNLKSIMLILQEEIKEADATITYDFSEVNQIRTIKSYLYSIMYNLLSNAIKFRNKNVPLQIQLKSTQDEKFVCFEVKDNGSGINLKRDGSKLFNLYKRFHVESIPGKGLGLNLVKTQVEALDGKIVVESEEGKGSIFKIYLPNK
jgi:PAS domain S-box-containing protein